MKNVDVWMLGGFLGLLATGCGAPANDSQQAASDLAQLVKTTVVDLKAGGEREISTYYATQEQVDLELQQMEEAKRRRDEGEELAVIVPTSCTTDQTIWLYDIPGAGKTSGYARCCVRRTGIEPADAALLIDVCGFPYVESLRAFNQAGVYGNTQDCVGDFPWYGTLMGVACPNSHYIAAFYYGPN